LDKSDEIITFISSKVLNHPSESGKNLRKNIYKSHTKKFRGKIPMGNLFWQKVQKGLKFLSQKVHA